MLNLEILKLILISIKVVFVHLLIIKFHFTELFYKLLNSCKHSNALVHDFKILMDVCKYLCTCD